MSHRFPQAGSPTYTKPWLEVHPNDSAELYKDYVVEYYICKLCGAQYSTQSCRPVRRYPPSDYPWIDSQTLWSFTEPCKKL